MAACLDCDLEYGSEKWTDVVIPDSYWAKIISAAPEHENDSGLLCFNCMMGRLKKLGLTNVPFIVTSGPLAFELRDEGLPESVVDKTKQVSTLGARDARIALEMYQAAWRGHDVAHFKSAANFCHSGFHRQMLEAREAATVVLSKGS